MALKKTEKVHTWHGVPVRVPVIVTSPKPGLERARIEVRLEDAAKLGAARDAEDSEWNQERKGWDAERETDLVSYKVITWERPIATS